MLPNLYFVGWVKIAIFIWSFSRFAVSIFGGIYFFAVSQAWPVPFSPPAEDGEEALGSMGNDTPLACLSEQNRPVFDFFYHLFAQAPDGIRLEHWKPLEAVKHRLHMILHGPSHFLFFFPDSNWCLLFPMRRENARLLYASVVVSCGVTRVGPTRKRTQPFIVGDAEFFHVGP